MSNIFNNKKMYKCGDRWVYCDRDCANCVNANSTYSTTTNSVSFNYSSCLDNSTFTINENSTSSDS